MPFTENPPPPPPPTVAIVDQDGKPTKAWVEYQIRLVEYIKRLIAEIP